MKRDEVALRCKQAILLYGNNAYVSIYLMGSSGRFGQDCPVGERETSLADGAVYSWRARELLEWAEGTKL